MNVRAATLNDAPEIARLCDELGYSVSVDNVHEQLRTIADLPTDGIAVAVSEDGAVIGWIQTHASSVLESGFRAEIVGLIVSGTVRRQGIGRRLVAWAEEWARAIGAPRIVVRSNVVRTESHAFYPALGYVATKTQLVYRKALDRRASDKL